MKLHLRAVGRLKAGPELTLIRDYQTRFDGIGRGLALGPLSMTEVDERRAQGMAAEGQALLAGVPAGARVIALDERGEMPDSPGFARWLGEWRDSGVTDCCLLIGGADGHDATVRNRADRLLALGRLTWPHMLVRVLVTEQLWRAASILAGHPYHRV